MSPALRDDGTPGPAVVTAWARLLPSGADPADATVPATAVASDGRTVDAAIAAGSAATPRSLVLAERAATGWHATLDGHALRAVDGGWRQTFEVPASGGHLVVWYAPPLRTGWLWLVAVVVGLTALLALPVRRRRVVRP